LAYGIAFLGGIFTAVLATGFFTTAVGRTGAATTVGAGTGAGVASAAPPVRLYKSAATLGSALFY